MKQDSFQWWLDNVHLIPETFRSWLGNHLAVSTAFVRKRIREREYKSILDCACGFSEQVEGFKADGYKIKYSGIDTTPYLVALAKERGLDVEQANIENIPHPDNSYDVVYARHILEHLPYYEKAMAEMLRVASKSVIVVFFLPLIVGEDIIQTDPALNHEVYINKYNYEKFKNFVFEKCPACNFEFAMCKGTNEIIIFIEKGGANEKG